MIIKRFVVGLFSTNCYLIYCDKTKKGAVIDPGGGEENVLRKAKNEGIVIEYIINTHGHPDHTSGNGKVKSSTGAKVAIHKDDAKMLNSAITKLASIVSFNTPPSAPDILLEEGDIIDVGNIQFKVIHTPGHTPGGICLLYEDVVFSGDTLFAGSIGRTDISGGSYKAIIESIKDKLLVLDDSINVYPGHGEFTTIGEERKYNPFLR